LFSLDDNLFSLDDRTKLKGLKEDWLLLIIVKYKNDINGTKKKIHLSIPFVKLFTGGIGINFLSPFTPVKRSFTAVLRAVNGPISSIYIYIYLLERSLMEHWNSIIKYTD